MRRTKLFFFLSITLSIGICLSFKKQTHDKLFTFPEIPYFPAMPTAGYPVTEHGVELGRYLFYDPIFSSDSTVSCASCHKQQSAFSDGPNKFSAGFNKQLRGRNTLPLFNLAWYPQLFWDGRANSIEQQVFHPIRDVGEMNLNWQEVTKKINRNPFYRAKINSYFGKGTVVDSNFISRLISQFERTLISHDAKYDRVIRGEAKFSLDELEGLELINDMTKGNCLHCHTTDANGLGTTGGFSNNGLDETKNNNVTFKDPGLGLVTGKREDAGKFKIPSLRNLLYTAPYMHDGRFKTLEEVLDFYSSGLKLSGTIDTKMEFVHQGGSQLTVYEKKKIILFLKTLSDPVFVSNPQFANPFL